MPPLSVFGPISNKRKQDGYFSLQRSGPSKLLPMKLVLSSCCMDFEHVVSKQWKKKSRLLKTMTNYFRNIYFPLLFWRVPFSPSFQFEGLVKLIWKQKNRKLKLSTHVHLLGLQTLMVFIILINWWHNSRFHIPDRTFLIWSAPTSGVWPISFSSETSIDGFWGSKVVRCSYGYQGQINAWVFFGDIITLTFIGPTSKTWLASSLSSFLWENIKQLV